MMKIKINKLLIKIGLIRNIERHNFIIKNIEKSYIYSAEYCGRVIDLGCGNAPYKKRILTQASQYVGVDWPNSMHSSELVDVFADLSNQLPLRSSIADIVISFQVLEHVPEPNLYIAECNRILRQFGKLYAIVPFSWHIHEEPFDYFRYTKYGLKYLLEKNGFNIEQIEPLSGFWVMIAMKINYHTVKYSKIRYFKYLLFIFWWITQELALLLDLIHKKSDTYHTTHYWIVAKKKSVDM